MVIHYHDIICVIVPEHIVLTNQQKIGEFYRMLLCLLIVIM